MMKSMKSIVVAFDQQRGIGAQNDLLWQRDLPADLKHFKDLTTGHTIIMGRRTFESIGRALPNRRNIVVSSTLEPRDDIEVAASLEEAYERALGDEVFVIGGGQLYEHALKSIDQLYVTEVQATFPEATVFFPPISPEQWKEVSREHHEADNRNMYAFDFVRYIRR